MTIDDIKLLEKSIHKVLRLRCTDGEVIVARIDFVDVLEEEIVYQMVSTTNESKYEQYDRQHVHLIHFEEIASVETDAPR